MIIGSFSFHPVLSTYYLIVFHLLDGILLSDFFFFFAVVAFIES